MMLEKLTTRANVVIMSNVKAQEIIRTRIADSEIAFSEIVVWLLAKPLLESSHNYKYRLAHVINGECVIRLDNESGKGDHLHFGSTESNYRFVSINQLLADFDKYIQRWNHENSNA
jgi:hypothetical protein